MGRPVVAPKRSRPCMRKSMSPEAQAHRRDVTRNASPDLSGDRHYAILIAERCRMRKHVNNMRATEVQHKEFVDLLSTLLSDEAFVRVLGEQGFTTMPRMLMEHLSGIVDAKSDAVAYPCENGGADNRLNDLCAEAANILSGRELPAMAIVAMRSMSSGRQIEVAHEMLAGHNYTAEFARALLAATPEHMRAVGARVYRAVEVRAIALSSIEQSLRKLYVRAGMLEPGHTDNLFYLALGGTVARAWTANGEIITWLLARYPRHAAFLEKLTVEAGRAAKASRRALKLSYT
ncbi:hypothetical protein LMG29739_05422 [Paraburkholderia solisilvae]|uniref:RepB plasmid partition domain-containing protein n=2 Tax=Paraburkholderia solisilvae TaxID=624376 RepID=A0A6J5ER49_9BURK|nr:hypothetical protein LMG29739_05422 [Paraburkholderia solisilvae]